MRKFFVLLKKELKELLTLQIIAPLILTAVLFIFIGNLLGKEQEKNKQPQDVIVLNKDQSAISEELISILGKNNLNIETVSPSTSAEDALDQAKNQNKVALIIIPENFSSSILNSEKKTLEMYTIIRNFSMMGGQKYGMVVAAVQSSNEVLSNMVMQKFVGSADPTILKNPLRLNEHIVVGQKQANISPAVVMSFVSQQTMFIPIILFFVIIMASQMIATAIANEKENKTLETLLSSPVDRRLIVIAKMAAAGIVALLASLVYIYGFRSYMQGVVGGEGMAKDVSEVIQNLGLTFNIQGYILLGLSLFVGILVALAIALILGAFAEDVKSTAGLTTPLMVLVMIPYFLTLFLDINSLSPTLRYLTYAIPFSHIFLAAPNIFLGHYLPVILGIIYQAIVFVVFAFIAARIFSSDLIMTMKLNFSKKKQ